MSVPAQPNPSLSFSCGNLKYLHESDPGGWGKAALEFGGGAGMVR
jgi:hypothetical protein